MNKTLLTTLAAALLAVAVQAKDIRIVEIATGGDMSSTYESSARTVLSTLSGISDIVADVAGLVLTVTYDADKVSAADIVSHLNKQEPRFEARQKGEAKTRAWVKAEQKQAKAEQKVEQERQAATKKDEQKQAKTEQKATQPSATATQQAEQKVTQQSVTATQQAEQKVTQQSATATQQAEQKTTQQSATATQQSAQQPAQQSTTTDNGRSATQQPAAGSAATARQQQPSTR